MKRRRFISWLSFGTLLTLLTSVISSCSNTSSTSTTNSAGKAPSQRPDGFIEAGKVQDLESSGSLSFKSKDGKNIVVVQDADNAKSLHALDSVCPHQGCAVNWDSESKSLACPCHGSKFDAQGKVLSGPATDPIKNYPVKIENNMILVSLS